MTVYHGRKYGDEKRDFFENADVFVFPTFYHNECFPLVLLEAMEFKLPLITTNEGGITDIVNDSVNGFVCRKQDAKSLSDSIACLLDNKELRVKMGENGYKKFKKQFTLQAFEDNMRRILREISC